ncbi:MAG: hypothetical protein GEU78_04535 [Actinobacteria bacterium]|nr:hypothetical protein [Actinomycetota bacterium]
MVALGAGFALKAQCLAGFDGRQHSRLCYNDIQPLYEAREVETHFPYVDGELRAGAGGAELADGAIEYPVLTGLFMWIAGLFAESSNGYLVVSAVLLAPFAVWTARTLARMGGRRALLWAAAPALVLYAFHNWDLLVVAAAVGALWAWRQRRYETAAVLFGLGGALKLYPLVFLVPLALELWSARSRGRALGVVGIGAGTWIAVNLPFFVMSPPGWWATYAFHSQRGPNFDNMWQLAVPGATPAALNLWTGVLIALSFLVAIVAGTRMSDNGSFPGIAVCAAMLAAFMLWNKVHSPQYTLWLLPFFVLLRVHIGWWVAYAAADLAVYVGVFRWFYDFVYLDQDLTAAKRLMIGGIWARAILLALLFVVFLRARDADPPGAGDRIEPQPLEPEPRDILVAPSR